jgi:puromycin-sensitive aminopeptidase
MLVEYLSVEVFRAGLLIYLERHKYANAATKDLWAALSEASGKDVSSMMTTWTRQVGYPVITVTEVSRGNNKRKLKLTQNRYLSNGVDYKDTSLWHIPITYITNNGTSTPFLLTERSTEIEVDDYQWIKLNPGQSGFYRVSYPNDSYESLTVAIKDKLLSPIDRLGIEEDVVSLSCAGVVSTKLALTVLNAYENEDNYTVVTGVSSNLSVIYNLIKREPVAEEFKVWARKLFASKGKALGWEPQSGESHLTTMLRSLVISNLARYDDPETVQQAVDKFDNYLAKNDSVVPDLRTTLYSVNIRKNKENYDKVQNIFKTTDLNEERIRCLRSLGSVQDDALLLKTLESSISDEVRSQDAFYVIMGVVDNTKGPSMTWKFFKDNFETFKKRYDGGGFLFGRIIKTATQALVYENEEKDVQEFFKTRETQSTKRTIAQSLEVIKLNARWLARSKDEIADWLKQNA